MKGGGSAVSAAGACSLNSRGCRWRAAPGARLLHNVPQTELIMISNDFSINRFYLRNSAKTDFAQNRKLRLYKNKAEN